MREQQRDSIILSAELSALTPEQNIVRTNLLSDMIEDLNITFVPVVGRYRGTDENSFLCVPSSREEFEALVSFALDNFGQESVLLNSNGGVLNMARGVYLSYALRCDMVARRLVRVTEAQALNSDAYTYRPDNQTFWVASYE
jgi:hypothetical protein